MSKQICYINGNDEMKLWAASALIEEFLSIVEIQNKKHHIRSKWKTPVELVSDKLIMFLDGLHTLNSPRKTDHPKCTILEKDTDVLDVIFQNYIQELLSKMLYVKIGHHVVLNQ